MNKRSVLAAGTLLLVATFHSVFSLAQQIGVVPESARTVANATAIQRQTPSFPETSPQTLRYKITAVRPPGAVDALAEAVNDQGQIVGYYTDKSKQTHGFLYENGVYQNIDFPGALYTFVMGIANSGEIVGNYQDQAGRHGFTLMLGTFTTFDIPGAQWIQVEGVNNQGWLSGFYGLPGGGSTGFFWDGATLSNITYPGPGVTSAFGLNDNGDIVGQYDSNGGTRDGFLYHGGSYSLITLPGVQLSKDVHYVEAIAIDNNGDIAGSYMDQDNILRVFELTGGTVSTLSLKNGRGFGVNNHQQIVGYRPRKASRGFSATVKSK